MASPRIAERFDTAIHSLRERYPNARSEEFRHALGELARSLGLVRFNDELLRTREGEANRAFETVIADMRAELVGGRAALQAPVSTTSLRRMATVERPVVDSVPATAVEPRITRERPKAKPTINGERLQAATREPWLALEGEIAATRAKGGDVGALLASRLPTILRVRHCRDLGEALRCLSVHCEKLGELTASMQARGESIPPKVASDVAALDTQTSQIVRNLAGRASSVTPDERNLCSDLLRQLGSIPGVRFDDTRTTLQQTYEAIGSRIALRDAQPAPESSVRDSGASVTAVSRAVVAGAGPSGLASAIKALERGVQVDLVDARNPWAYTRPVQLSLKQSTVDQLQRLGVLDHLRPQMTMLQDYRENNTVTGVNTTISLGGRPADANRPTQSGRVLATESSVAVVKLADLERAMFERALELGARPIANATVELQPSGEGANRVYNVIARRSGRDGGPSETIDLGRPEAVVLAEGSRGTFRDTFGVEWQGENNPRARMIAGLLERNAGPSIYHWAGVDADNRVVRTTIMGHTATQHTWSLVQVPDNHIFEGPADVERFFRQRTAQALGVASVDDAPLVFGGRSEFPTQNRVVDRAAFFASPQQAVLAVGDLRGVGTPFAGLGAQTGITTDAPNVGNFIDRVAEVGITRAAQAFDKRVRANAQAWHRAGTVEFIADPASFRRALGHAAEL